MVTEVVRPVYWPLISMGSYSSVEVDAWDGLNGITENPIGIDEILAGEEFFKFYNMQLVAGEWISDKSDVREVNIMETTARTMGWTPEEAIGKHIFYCNKEVEPMTVIGVIKTVRTGRLPRTCLILYLSIPINHSGCGRVALSSSSINRDLGRMSS